MRRWGIKDVEAAGYFGHTPQQVKQAMQAAGLNLVSAHYSLPDLNRDLEQTIAFNKELGVSHIICSFPGIKDPSRLKDKRFSTIVQSFTMEDYRWNADQFNQIGAKVKAAGMRFGYHNHTMEFGKQDGVIPFDEMIRLTDPSLVTFEMDCGWVTVGGGDPAHYLREYPKRISMLHIKDFKRTDTACVGDRAASFGGVGHGDGELPRDLRGGEQGRTSSTTSSSRRASICRRGTR